MTIDLSSVADRRRASCHAGPWSNYLARRLLLVALSYGRGSACSHSIETKGVSSPAASELGSGTCLSSRFKNHWWPPASSYRSCFSWISRTGTVGWHLIGPTSQASLSPWLFIIKIGRWMPCLAGCREDLQRPCLSCWTLGYCRLFHCFHAAFQLIQDY